jgi:hypothetical protein
MAWYHPGFAYKKAIVIPHAKVSGGSDLPDFPFLVSINSADLATVAYGGLVQGTRGADLLFVDSTETRELAYEVENYDPATGALLCWVRIPRLSVSADTTIYLYFGNPTIIAPLSNPIGTWDAYYTSVWHLGNGTTVNAYDSTTNNVGYPQTALPATGLMGGSALFTGTQTIQSLNTGGLDMSSSSALVLYGSNVADGTLTTACQMATGTGGTETSSTTTVTGSNTYAEIYSQGVTNTGSATLGSPSGHGWIYRPGAGTFAGGNWSATITLSSNSWSGSSTTTHLQVRFYKYSGGTYTSIGTIQVDITGTAKTTYSFPATAMPSVTLGANDALYVDLWWIDTNTINTDNPTVYLSNSASQGVDSDMLIATSTFTPTGWVGNTITLSAWAKRLPSTNTWQPLVAHGSGTGRDYDFAFSGGGQDGGSGTNTSPDQLVFLYRDTGDTTWQCYATSTTYTDTTSWHHYCLTYTYGLPSSAQFYVDSVPVSGSWTNGTGTVPPFATYDNLALGSTTDQTDELLGYLDEVHISKGIARSAGWIATEYANQNNPQASILVGETIPFQGNIDLPLITAYGVTTATNTVMFENTSASGVQLVLTVLALDVDNSLTVTLTGEDELSGQVYQLASYSASALGPNAMTLYPGIPNSSQSVSDRLSRTWQVNVSPTTNEPASYLLGASLIV